MMRSVAEVVVWDRAHWTRIITVYLGYHKENEVHGGGGEQRREGSNIGMIWAP